MRPALLFHLLLALLVCAVAAQHAEQAQAAQRAFDAGEYGGPFDDGLADEFTDVCTPLNEARDLLTHMQPLAHAHLPKKLGGISPSTGLGDGLGWGHDGPLSTALRLLPRFLAGLNPLNLVGKIPEHAREPRKVGRQTRERAARLLALIDEAEKAGCSEATAVRADVRMFPPKGLRQDLPEAFAAYRRFLEVSSDPHSQFMVGFFHATGLGGAERDQARATLYYTFAALQGYKPAQMAMGYRYWAGIGVKEDCNIALEYYESAATNAYNTFLAGPAGGETLLLTRTRLSDRYGGVFGPYASWASTGANGLRTAIKAIKAAATGESEAEVLEFYQYRSDRDFHSATVRLGKFFYLGSVHPRPARMGISSGAEAVSEIPQSYDKARQYYYHVARKLWPVDYDANGKPALKKRLTKEAEDSVKEYAKEAASVLGRMAMRGEGMPKNYALARLWYGRAAALGDAEAHNGLGILYRDGLDVAVNREKAFKYFEYAAGFELPEAQVNIAKMYLDAGDTTNAVPFLEAALRNGSPFEAFHLRARVLATQARRPDVATAAGECGASVSYFKLVSETGAWDDDYLGEADRAWGRGEEDKAMLGWWIAAEMGYEAGQNNVAFLMSRELTLGDALPDDTPLALWTRSAAQGNADAMVMVGDHYYRGDVPSSESNGTVGPDYPRAFGYYQTAAYKSSSMAYWNLGYMYENGQGVPQDWHLAKRNYDFSLATSPDAYLPWMLSLSKLYARSWWTDMRTRGATPGLPLFEDDGEGPTLWESIKQLFVGPVLEDGGDADTEYEDYSGAGWGGPEDGAEGDAGEGGGGGGGNRNANGGGALDAFDDDLIETLVILGLTGLIMGLVWLRGRWARIAPGFAQAQQQQQ